MQALKHTDKLGPQQRKSSQSQTIVGILQNHLKRTSRDYNCLFLMPECANLYKTANQHNQATEHAAHAKNTL